MCRLTTWLMPLFCISIEAMTCIIHDATQHQQVACSLCVLSSHHWLSSAAHAPLWSSELNEMFLIAYLSALFSTAASTCACALHQGPRNCLGQHLALLEARVVLSLMVKRFKYTTVRADSGERHPSVVPVGPKNGMLMLLE